MNVLRRHALPFLMLSIIFLAGGCHPHKKQIPTGKAIEINNVFAHPSYHHDAITRVFLLPIENSFQSDNVELQRHNIAQSIMRNFAKFHYFSLSYDKTLSPETPSIVDLTKNNFDRVSIGALAKARNAQAIMAISVAEYRPFFPMLLHVKGSLIDAQTGQRIWEFAHVFDGNDSNIVNGMRIWWNSNMAGGSKSNRFDLNRLRPEFFMNYVFHTMAESYSSARIANVETIENIKAEQEKQALKEEKR